MGIANLVWPIILHEMVVLRYVEDKIFFILLLYNDRTVQRIFGCVMMIAKRREPLKIYPSHLLTHSLTHSLDTLHAFMMVAVEKQSSITLLA